MPKPPTTPARAWESFWHSAPPAPGEVFWDASPRRVVGRQLPLLREHFTPPLPVVDLGCGNGTQTAELAGSFDRVIGLDVSPAAIALARRRPEGPSADFRAADAADPDTARALHAELGDCHVYVRGVLHQAPAGDQPRLAAAIATLLGAGGRAFVVEPAEAAAGVLMELMRRPQGPPPTLAAVFDHGIAPAELPDAALPGLFTSAGLAVLDGGELPLATTEPGPDGTGLELPSRWLVAGRTA